MELKEKTVSPGAPLRDKVNFQLSKDHPKYGVRRPRFKFRFFVL